MTSVSDAFAGTDFSNMPPKSHFTARDGTRLDYRAYPGDPARVVVLVHGSSGTSASMHLVAKAIHAKGATVFALAMRGHDGTGRSGDVDYIGQLDDDVVDFIKTLGPRKTGETRTLLGFSSGGGFSAAVRGRSERCAVRPADPKVVAATPLQRTKFAGERRRVGVGGGSAHSRPVDADAARNYGVQRAAGDADGHQSRSGGRPHAGLFVPYAAQFRTRRRLSRRPEARAWRGDVARGREGRDLPCRTVCAAAQAGAARPDRDGPAGPFAHGDDDAAARAGRAREQPLRAQQGEAQLHP